MAKRHQDLRLGRSMGGSLVMWLTLVLAGALFGGELRAQTSSLQYFYDDSSQLTRVIDGDGGVINYNYDAAGNLLSVTTTTVDALGPPVIATLDPVRWNAGNRFRVVVSGANFFGGSVTLSHPDIILRSAFVNDEQAFLTVEAPIDSARGTFDLTITTDEGSDSVSFQVLGPLPTVTDIAPSRGSALGGTEVLVRGRFFTEDTEVTLGGTPLVDTVFVDEGLIRGKTPIGNPNQLADLAASNPNGTANLGDAFQFLFPFSLPGATGVAIGAGAPVTISLLEPALTEMTFEIFTLDTLRVGVPNTVTIALGATDAALPVMGVRPGVGVISVTLAQAFQLQTTVFVSGPLAGDFDVTSGPIGMALGGPPATMAAVGAMIPGRITFAPIVGGHVTRESLPVARVAAGGGRTVRLDLGAPAPEGGVEVTLRSSNPSVVTLNEPTIVIAEGQAAVDVPINGGATGRAFLVAAFGQERRQWEILVGSVALQDPLVRSGVVGALAPGQDTATAVPVGALVAPREPTVAPVVGTEVDSNP